MKRQSINIEEILKNIGTEDVPADVHKIAQEASNNFSMSLVQSKQPKQRILLEYIMKSTIVKLAIAAIVIIACVIGLSLWRGTESGIALADVLDQIEKVKSVGFQWSSKMTGGDPNTNKLFNGTRWTGLSSQEYGEKSTSEALDPNGEWSQVFQYACPLPQKKTEIFIYHKEKIYISKELDDAETEESEQDNFAGDPLMILKGILQTEYESLGRSTIDGVEVAGFRSTDPNKFYLHFGKNQQCDVKLWVDVKTLLPVRYDVVASAEVMGDRLTHDVMMHDFQWGVPVAAADFEPPVPEGYTVRVIKLPPSNEETAIQGLKECVELLGGYPEKISDIDSQVRESKTPAALRLYEEIKGLGDGESTIRCADFLMPMRGLERFGCRLERDKKDPAYYGKTVTPKDADKVLMRWKVSDNEYRVIFGDLHAETVTSEKLAELEKGISK